ncbi:MULTISPECIES: hypothetical protein [Nostocales]|uniref:Uncharacterized protein n=1 Tax=Tolypothrix bouteillei VB521301 TaxID=1479485 RepID=A0A0C1NB63_9CYAN
METSDRIDRIERQLENLTTLVTQLAAQNQVVAVNTQSNTEAIAQLRESIDVANDRITNNVQQLAGLMARASQRTQGIETQMQEMQANINQILEYLFRQSQNGSN